MYLLFIKMENHDNIATKSALNTRVVARELFGDAETSDDDSEWDLCCDPDSEESETDIECSSQQSLTDSEHSHSSIELVSPLEKNVGDDEVLVFDKRTIFFFIFTIIKHGYEIR